MTSWPQPSKNQLGNLEPEGALKGPVVTQLITWQGPGFCMAVSLGSIANLTASRTLGESEARQKLDTPSSGFLFPDTPVEWRSLPPFHRTKLALREVKEPPQGPQAKQ